MAKGPLVHCITNAVTAPFVADCVAAVGGRPIMAEDPADCADLAKVADGLCINLGQLTEHKREAILASLKNRGDRPWVLDPVGVGALPSRLKFAQQLLEFKPTIIRGNASEVYALATGKASGSGTDSVKPLYDRREWFELVKRLPAQEVVATNIYLTPMRRDAAYTSEGEFRFEGGHHYMGQLSGFGCALSAICSTYNTARDLIEPFNRAGRRTETRGVGDFRNAFVSSLAREVRSDVVRESLRLYFVLGPQDCSDFTTLLRTALASGITAFQYRPKNMTFEEAHFSAFKPLGVESRKSRAAFFGNDDWRLAAKFGGNLHLGQTDGDPKEAREKLGPDAIIGLSVSQPNHWDKYDPRYVDYVGIGPFAVTQTKLDARQPLGAEGIRQLRKGYEHVPAVAIGGIDESNALEALSSGVDGIAVVSAIARADDPAATTRNLAALVQSHFQPKDWTYD